MSAAWAGEGTSYPGKVLEYTTVNEPRFVADAKGRYWNDIPSKQGDITLPNTEG